MAVKVRERPRKSGIWWIFIDHKGKRKAKKIGRDKKLAFEIAKKVEAKLVLGDFRIEDNAPLFKEYAERWICEYVKAFLRESTCERYQDALRRYVYPEIGNRPIDEIRRGEVRNLLLRIHNKGISKSMIRIIHATISGPMSYALDEELIPANPLIGITKRFQLKVKEHDSVGPLNRQEVILFLDKCREIFPEYYPFFLCAFRTGMRLGELLGLRWGDIDWNGRFVEVRRSYKIGRFGPTKTGKTRRVDLSDQLLEVLRELNRFEKLTYLLQTEDTTKEALFCRNGKPIEQNFIRRIFKRILHLAGIREVRFHDIRHTFASLLLSGGASPVYVKEQLGHTSIQMTVDIYGHLIPGSNRDVVNQLDERQPTATDPQLYQMKKA